MSRAQREIDALRSELWRIAKNRDDDREALRRAVREHPECPRCAAMSVALETARDTIDGLAAARPQ